ncbi:MAG: VCBS repeat-containing protein [Bacteroidia bacterium]|nr:VCBS repeat-containing protein [Bacteroidia bacterium]
MKRIILLFILACTADCCLSQGGWIKDTNPLNGAISYTTNYPYAGVSFVELNGDEYVDLHLSPRTIYFNNGDGTFGPKMLLPFQEQVGTAGSSSADLDNDGDNDLVIACTPSKVYFNNGNGTFSDKSSLVPGFSFYGAWAAAIGDCNEDRELDMVFAHANGFHSPSVASPCRLYLQQGTSFMPTQESGYPFTTNLFSYTNPFWSDYDLDGDMDLFIASGPASSTPDYDYCYKNMKMETGADTLIAMTSELFALDKQDGQCYNFIDYDNDGDFDLCITNYFGAPTRFYKNNNGNYNIVATVLSSTSANLANCWGDYDNDGDQDVIITTENQSARYYRNEGNGTFVYLANGLNTSSATNGISNADYDNDGDLDLFTNGVGSFGNTSSVGLYINDTVAVGRNFINLKLIGTVSNRSAIGAIVRIKATIYGNTFWQIREVNAQNTFQGQNDLRVHFGLGDAVILDSISVTWPSGQTDHYTYYLANGFYTLTESMVTTGLAKSNSGSSVSIYPNPVINHVTIKVGGSLFSKGQFCISDPRGNVVCGGVLQGEFTHLNLAELPSGVYFLKVTSAEHIQTKKIIKHN